MPSTRRRAHELDLLVVAAFSRHDAAFAWTQSQLEQRFGPVVVTSQSYAFIQTKYYEPSMGPGLRKLFYAFRDLVKSEQLPDIKNLTNKLEAEFAALAADEFPRPLNLDPGLISLGKFILATTKDQAHRIYLRDGIFAEVTLRFQSGQFHPWPWTYADYRQPEVLAFLRDSRNYLYSRLRPAVDIVSDEQKC